MNHSLKNKTACITGASSGIGLACAQTFAKLGADLIICARRIEKLIAISKELAESFQIKVRPIQLDVRNQSSVEETFIKLNVDIDILVNNAGLALSSDKVQDGSIANWDTMIDTNIKGLLYVTKAVLPRMLARNKGHIINIGSVAGHGCYITGNVYCATKHAVRAISKSLRLDLIGTAIKVSEIDPGAVETEFSEVRWNDKEKAKNFYQGFHPLVAEDIADAVAYCVTRPQHVNISELVVYPQAQASLTEIYRGSDSIKSPFDIKK